jgi:predicted DCC family thiol-disulfide oxidoreductase YuxK
VKHLIFFDSECAFCRLAVNHILALDRKNVFLFAPLYGKTFKEAFFRHRQNPPKEESMILIENYPSEKIWFRARAVFRTYWLLGGWRKFLGVFCFAPSFLVDPFYRWIASNRYRVAKRTKNTVLNVIDEQKFLP